MIEVKARRSVAAKGLTGWAVQSREVFMRRWIILIVAIVGGLGLMAAAHHFLVVAWRGDGALSGFAASTCGACHGSTYD